MDTGVRILCVDDERNVLRAIERLFLDDDYEIITAASGDEGLDVLREVSPVQIVLSDYRMPGMNGVDFLKEVCEHWPETVRIVLSGYADTAAVVSAINEGRIYKFIPKPWNDDELKVTISNAIERYMLHERNAELARELQKKNEELQKVNDNLERLVAERTSELIFQNRALTHSQNILDALPVAVLGIDSDGLIVQCNEKGVEMFGSGGATILGMDRTAVLSEELNGMIDGAVRDGLQTGDFRIGGVSMVRFASMRYPDGQEGVVLIFFGEGDHA
ncbi:MAG TPA: response regulator [Nitrospirae bacterium]|nr:response regulator [Nitrospirota bacterium]